MGGHPMRHPPAVVAVACGVPQRAAVALAPVVAPAPVVAVAPPSDVRFAPALVVAPPRDVRSAPALVVAPPRDVRRSVVGLVALLSSSDAAWRPFVRASASPRAECRVRLLAQAE